MIAGRLHWRPPRRKLAGRHNLAAFDFPDGSLVLPKPARSAAHRCTLLSGEEALRSRGPGRDRHLHRDLASFRAVLTAENRTLKSALTDPRLLSGIGNAYSDEILHAAQLSPIAQTHKLKPDEWERLFAATREHARSFGSSACERKRASPFPKKSPRFARTWRRMDDTAEPCPGVAKRSCGFAMRTMKRTTAPAARQVGKSSRTEVCPGSYGLTGPVRWKNSKPSSAAERLSQAGSFRW